MMTRKKSLIVNINKNEIIIKFVNKRRIIEVKMKNI